MSAITRRVRKWYRASDWSRMTGADIAWHLAGWALGLFAVLVVGVAYGCAVALWPRPMCVLTFAAIFAVAWCWVGFWFGNHAGGIDHDRLDYAEQHNAALVDSEYREQLALGGPITDPTPVVVAEVAGG